MSRRARASLLLFFGVVVPAHLFAGLRFHQAFYDTRCGEYAKQGHLAIGVAELFAILAYVLVIDSVPFRAKTPVAESPMKTPLLAPEA